MIYAQKAFLEHVRASGQHDIDVQFLADIDVAFRVALERKDVDSAGRRLGRKKLERLTPTIKKM